MRKKVQVSSENESSRNRNCCFYTRSFWLRNTYFGTNSKLLKGSWKVKAVSEVSEFRNCWINLHIDQCPNFVPKVTNVSLLIRFDKECDFRFHVFWQVQKLRNVIPDFKLCYRLLENEWNANMQIFQILHEICSWKRAGDGSILLVGCD